MNLQNENLSPRQREALEQLLGRELFQGESVSLWSFTVQSQPEAVRLEAAEKLRAFLATPRDNPAVSDEEINEAIVEAMREIRPGYTEIK